LSEYSADINEDEAVTEEQVRELIREPEPVQEEQPQPPNPRRPLTQVPRPPPEPITQRVQQQQRQQVPQQKEEPSMWGPGTQPQQQQQPTKPFYGDYDEERELRAKKMPNIYSYASKQEQIEVLYGKGALENEAALVEQYGPIKYRPRLKQVLSTPNFSISDIHIMDSANKNVIGTFATVVIKPHAQVAPLFIGSKEPDEEKQKRVIYEIMYGQGLLCIQNLTRHIMKSDIFYVEANVEHNFFNTTNQLLIYRLFYDGYLDLRDRYFPTARAQEVAKESRREIFNAQEQRNVPVGQYSINRPKSEDTFT